MILITSLHRREPREGQGVADRVQAELHEDERVQLEPRHKAPRDRQPVSINKSINKCVYIYIYIYIYMHTHVMYIHMYIHIDVCMYVCMHIYIYIYIYTY